MSIKKYLSPREVADEFNISIHTLRKWRSDGRGPVAIKVGQIKDNKRSGSIRYDRSELEKLFNQGVMSYAR